MTKEEFLKDMANWSNHRHLLWEALELTKDDPNPVIEMGMGNGSTPYLAQYCTDTGRQFISYENHLEWFNKCQQFNPNSYHVTDWDVVSELHRTPSVLFVDHAPGERRHVDIKIFANRAKIIVIHDTEPSATGYMVRPLIPMFKYWKDFESEGAWASMASNFIKF